MNHSTDLRTLLRILQNIQCLDCNTFSEIGIIYCSCGRKSKVFAESCNTSRRLIATLLQFPDSCHSEEFQSRTKARPTLKRQIMFSKAKEMLKKARQEKHGSHPKDTESHWRSTTLAKRISCFSIVIALERHDYTAARAERLQNAKPWILRLQSLRGPKCLLDSDKNLPYALKQCLKMQDAHLAETQKSLTPIRPEHQQRQRLDQQIEGGENFRLLCRSPDWMAVLQRATGKLRLAASSSSTSQWH